MYAAFSHLASATAKHVVLVVGFNVLHWVSRGSVRASASFVCSRNRSRSRSWSRMISCCSAAKVIPRRNRAPLANRIHLIMLVMILHRVVMHHLLFTFTVHSLLVRIALLEFLFVMGDGRGRAGQGRARLLMLWESPTK